MAAVITIAEWEACTEVVAVVATTWVSVVATEAAGAVIVSPLTSYRVIQEAKIARPTNSPPLNRRQALSRRRRNIICHRCGIKESSMPEKDERCAAIYKYSTID